MPLSFSAFLTKTLLSAALILSASTAEAAATINTSALGPLKSLAAKSTVCNVLDYGGVADGKTDIGPAISKAFTSCVSGKAATLYIPEGEYSLATGVKLNGGSGWAFQIDGLITLTSGGSFGGNAFVIQNGKDVEVYSSTNKGAINGQGYIARRDSTSQNARLMRFINVSNLSVHNLIYVDSPAFHLVFNDVSNLDMYYITIRGPDIGGSDGIDLICTDNCHLHDFEVTNRDECVSVKSPSNNALIENALCNHSGGMSIGSLTADVKSSADTSAVSNITMRNVYSYKSTQSLMIKTYPGGSGAVGYVKDCLFENFWSYGGAYVLDIDQYWQSKTTPNTGAVALSGLTFRNWTGSMSNGASRGAVVIRGSSIVPVQDVTIEGFSVWTETGNKVVNQCKNVYGAGECIKAAQGDATYTTTVTRTATPTGWVAATAPTWAVEGYGVTVAIPVYTPAVRWPVVSSGLAAARLAATPTSKIEPVSS